MSTTARVIVKVRKEDIGKTMRFDEKLLPSERSLATMFSPFEKNKRSGKDYGNVSVTLTTSFISILIKWDGDLVIKELSEHYNTYDKALNLVLAGSISGIVECDPSSRDGITPYYLRGMDWGIVRPYQNDSLASHCVEDYDYLFEDGKWEMIS